MSEARRDENCAAVLSLTSDPRFRADSRWIAMMTSIPLDDVNVALHWLLRLRRLVMRSRTTWNPGAPQPLRLIARAPHLACRCHHLCVPRRQREPCVGSHVRLVCHALSHQWPHECKPSFGDPRRMSTFPVPIHASWIAVPW
jgi:hypothetical protein